MPPGLPFNLIAIGVSDEEIEDKWVNVNNNQEVSYKNFSPSEPNGNSLINFVTFDGYGQWWDIPGSQLSFIICQKPSYLC